MRNGYGIESWPDGRRFLGNFLNDKRHGHGNETWPDGSHYMGEYRVGKPVENISKQGETNQLNLS